MNKCDMNYIEILKNRVDQLEAEKIEAIKEVQDLRAEVVRVNKELAIVENMYDYKAERVADLEEELKSYKEEENKDSKLLKEFVKANNYLNRDNEALRVEVDDWRRLLDDTNHVNAELIERVDELEDELEMAIKGQEDFKKIINDLEAINRELLEELKGKK